MKKSTEELVTKFFERYPALLRCKNDILSAVNLLTKVYHSGNKIMVCGNGGSAADAQHIVGELMKGFVLPRCSFSEKRERIRKAFPEKFDILYSNLQDAIPAISLVGEVSLSTAYANDKLPVLVFAQSVYGLGKPGDVLLAISTSGDSENIIHAAQVAKALDISVIGLTGQNGGNLKENGFADVTLCVPSEITYEIQEYHLPVYHVLCLCVENEIFG